MSWFVEPMEKDVYKRLLKLYPHRKKDSISKSKEVLQPLQTIYGFCLDKEVQNK